MSETHPMLLCPRCRNYVKMSDQIIVCPNCKYENKYSETNLESEVFVTTKTDEIFEKPSGELGNFEAIDCPRCGHGRALFKEVQTRSADEATTVFYQCVLCEHNWRQQ